MASPRKTREGGFDPKGKRIKQEILARARGHIPLSPTQKKWLGRFIPPPSAPRHPDGSYAMRQIAMLNARKASLQHLSALRNAPRRAGVPPPIIFREGPVVESRAQQEKREREEREEAAQEAEQQERLRVRDAWVAALVRARFGHQDLIV
ncbi:hypothetical protein C8J57DRAFT_1583683 [Mycena rebaudengoi]|nr:hypothetical protein C8J57DRAFT_1583683 [Mycena rebaudengoi]